MALTSGVDVVQHLVKMESEHDAKDKDDEVKAQPVF
jgi:hypothetical protein